MNYMEYYRQCVYAHAQPQPIDKFSYKVLDPIDITGVHEVLFKDIDSLTPDDWIIKVNYKKEYADIVRFLFEQIKGPLDELYQCPIFIESFNIYRSIPFHKRTTSTIYHYDNTPQTMLRALVYLNDVESDDDGPVEFCKDCIMEPTRQGPNHWYPPPNNSRLSDEQVAKYEKVKVYGSAGTTTLFYPSCVHRANPPAPGRVRDVVNFIIRPTHDPSDLYKYLKGFERGGSPLMNPKDRYW